MDADACEVKKITEEELNQCQTGPCWVCPITECKKLLSRKQNLKIHLFTQHSVTARAPHKRYKLYEHDASYAEPRSSKYKRLHAESCEHGTSGNSEQQSNGSFSEASTEIDGLMTNRPVVINSENTTVTSRDGCTSVSRNSNISAENCDNISTSTASDSCTILDSDQTIEDPSLTTNYIYSEITEIWDDVNIVDMEMCDEDSDSERSDFSGESDDGNDSQDIDSQRSSADIAPLYVLPPSDNIYISPITYKEHLLSLCTYASKSNLSSTAFKRTMELVKIHLPPNSLCETNLTTLKEECGFGGDYMQFHDYCLKCGALFLEDRTVTKCETPNCSEDRYEKQGDKHGKAFFVTGNTKKQLQDIIGLKENWEQLAASYTRTSQAKIYDIQDGHGYKKLKENEQLINEKLLTLTLFTDGVSLFKSTKASFWPVYLVINELPPKQRFLRKNMILWGLWQGIGKPRMNTFFCPFVALMKKFYEEGITVSSNGELVNFKVLVVLATMDLQARSIMLNMMAHNGLCGCVFCEEPGIVVKSGKGHVRSYPYREPKAKERTTTSVAACVLAAIQTNKTVQGFKGKAVINFTGVWYPRQHSH